MNALPRLVPAALPAANVVGVGVDLTSTAAVRQAIDDFGETYLYRVFTPGELEECRADADPVPRLAARFAAKEAAFKALGIDDVRPAWTSIEVRREPAGWCRLAVSGKAAGIARERGIADLLVSLTHEDELAAAVVIATSSVDRVDASSGPVTTNQQQLGVGAEETVVVEHQCRPVGIPQVSSQAEG